MHGGNWAGRLQERWYSDLPPPWPLRPLAAGFGAAAALRRRWLGRRARPLPAPVIVVGNVTLGGTGKTPFVIWLVEQLRLLGWRPGVISRGYGGRSAHWPRPVTADTDPLEVGDEPVLIAARTGAPVAVGPDRNQAARLLLGDASANCIVSDDGLQHYALWRDLEIAVVDGARGLGNGALLPAGPLREPPTRLLETDLVVVNGGGWRSGGVMHLDMHLLAEHAQHLMDDETRPLEAFEGLQVHAVAGIGHPERFFVKLERAGLHVTPHPFPDHHSFTPADLAFGDGRPVFMTEKDAVKCRRFAAPNQWFLPVTAVLSAADTAAVQKFATALRNRRPYG